MPAPSTQVLREAARLTPPDELAARIAQRLGPQLAEGDPAHPGGCEVAPCSVRRRASGRCPQPDWERLHQGHRPGYRSGAVAGAPRSRRATSCYELLAKCIPADRRPQGARRGLASKLDDELKPAVMACAAFYEHRVQQVAQVATFHLEAFVAVHGDPRAVQDGTAQERNMLGHERAVYVCSRPLDVSSGWPERGVPVKARKAAHLETAWRRYPKAKASGPARSRGPGLIFIHFTRLTR